MAILGREHIEAFMRLQPHYDIHSNREPGKFSNSTDLPDTAHLTLHIKLESEEFVI